MYGNYVGIMSPFEDYVAAVLKVTAGDELGVSIPKALQQQPRRQRLRSGHLQEWCRLQQELQPRLLQNPLKHMLCFFFLVFFRWVIETC